MKNDSKKRKIESARWNNVTKLKMMAINKSKWPKNSSIKKLNLMGWYKECVLSTVYTMYNRIWKVKQVYLSCGLQIGIRFHPCLRQPQQANTFPHHTRLESPMHWSLSCAEGRSCVSFISVSPVLGRGGAWQSTVA